MKLLLIALALLSGLTVSAIPDPCPGCKLTKDFSTGGGAVGYGMEDRSLVPDGKCVEIEEDVCDHQRDCDLNYDVVISNTSGGPITVKGDDGSSTPIGTGDTKRIAVNPGALDCDNFTSIYRLSIENAAGAEIAWVEWECSGCVTD